MSKLKAYRQQAGLPLFVLARKAGVSHNTLWMWERWNLPPKRWETVERIARVLGVSPEELLQEPENEKEVNDA